MPSSVVSHSVPPFYACYFLRSIASPSSTYIGSTPAPPRRKRQHNGDLTQGAFKTMRARPWEMECIVYGFSSKIAALQFEWAWTKPHLSRHLKVLPNEIDPSLLPAGEGVNSAECLGAPLFPSTSATPGQTKWGKPKRRRPKAPSSPNSRLLVMRALLKSEPFSGWGLKVAFFTEWSWLASHRLEAQHRQLLQARPYEPMFASSRSGIPLPMTYPTMVCDFKGVDRLRKALLEQSESARRGLGVAANRITKKRQKNSKAASLLIDPVSPAWPELLPKSSTLKALDACDADFQDFPVLEGPIVSTDITRKAKRSQAVPLLHQVSSDEDESDDESRALSASFVDNSESTTLLGHRMRFNDNDLSEHEWARFKEALASIGNGQHQTYSTSAYMKDALQLRQAPANFHSENTLTPTATCAICSSAINLMKHLEFSLCPRPYKVLLPKPDEALQSVEQHAPCAAVFHIHCLADAFLNQNQALQSREEVEAILPSHGQCPSCSSDRFVGNNAAVAYWADIVRAGYRRSERFERLVQHLVKAGQTLDELEAGRQETIALPTKVVKRKTASLLDTSAQETSRRTSVPKPRKTRKLKATSD